MVGVDGTAFIWEGSMTGNMILINCVTPICKLDNIGGTNQAVCQSVFLDEESNTLFTLSADHIVR
jgi:hypothetical protein